MAELVSLAKARKARERAAKRVTADQNAVKFGRSKAEKDLERALAEKAKRDLDGHQKP
ncbi:MAG: DUF4169 family protein [Paracoccaceae bacterium]